jgi:hypothetical protein
MKAEVGWLLSHPLETYVWWRCTLDRGHITNTVSIEPR